MKIAFLILLFFFGAVAQAKDKPNIVYVMCDDLGYGDVQCLNPEHGKIATPSIDRLASQGMVFTDAHSGSSVCTPTRYGLLTGRYSWRTSLQKGVVQGFAPNLIAEDRPTVASFLTTEWISHGDCRQVASELSICGPIHGRDFEKAEQEASSGWKQDS